jgi:O-antigen/teichoic acid export membrane protein
VINSGFLIGVGALNVMKAVVAAAFLTQAEFGLWSILLLGVLALIGLKSAAVADKYIQQDEDDQELAFQKSFTLEILTAGIMMSLAILLAPVLALLYDEPDLIVPMLVLSLMLPGLAAQAPIWVFYRRMDFLRQRLLLSVDPIASFVITGALAIAGAGYWSLVIGAVAGAWAGGLVALVFSPYRLRVVYDGQTARRYASFSWPLMLAVGSGILIGHVAVFVGNAAIGLAATGAIGLAAILGQYADRVDAVLTQAMYPAICRVAGNRALLQEAFEKSNRLALMWAVPFGAALSLFAHDFVTHVLGPEWESATILLQTFGITAAINHIGFNWGAFYRAIGRTKPVGVVTFVALLAFLAFPTPLIFFADLEGFAFGMVAMTLIALAARGYFVLKLFPEFSIVRYVTRALLPVTPAVALLLAARQWIEAGERTATTIVAELVVFAALVGVLTYLAERTLLREVRGYLTRPDPLETQLV